MARFYGKRLTADASPPAVKPKERRTALWVALDAAAVLLAVAAIVGVLEHFRIVNIPAVRKLEEGMGIFPYGVEALYDENGALTGYAAYKKNGDYFRYDAEGALAYCSISERNAAGRRIRTNVYDGDGALNCYYVYEYDAAGYTIRICEYNRSGVLLATHDGGWDLIEKDKSGVLQGTYGDKKAPEEEPESVDLGEQDASKASGEKPAYDEDQMTPGEYADDAAPGDSEPDASDPRSAVSENNDDNDGSMEYGPTAGYAPDEEAYGY